jgi:hypothetical protein
MREIKFRGLGKNDIWRYGYYFAHKEAIQSYHYIRENSSDHRIDPLTLGQYTGLKDKNGVDIYEGDLLDENGYLFEVIWDKQWAKFKLQWRTKAIQFPEWNRGVQMSIIGNIYQNQDLIKPNL